ncbi:MAG: hypothetical protein ACTSVI_17475, partial [Promethearchaeota archaeon]
MPGLDNKKSANSLRKTLSKFKKKKRKAPGIINLIRQHKIVSIACGAIFVLLLIYPLQATFEYTMVKPHSVQFGSEFFMDPSLSNEEIIEQLDFLKNHNITYLKLKDFQWDVLQPNETAWDPSTWNWTRYDFIVNACLSRGFRIMGMTASLTGYSIEYITSIPDWVDYWILDDHEIERYANYTKVLVEHYKGQITEWQIGNEVDLIWLLHHKRGGHGNALSQEGLNATEWQLWPSEDNIIRWYHQVSEAVKAVNESYEVHVNLVCGCSGWQGFIRRIIEETQVNGIGVDIYPGTIHMSYAEEYYIELLHFKRWIEEVEHDRPIELVLAEFGYAADSTKFPTLEGIEAQVLRDHFAVIQRCPVKRAFFHQIFDKPENVYGYSIPGYEQHIGVVDRNLVPSPAFYSILPAFSGKTLPISTSLVLGSFVRFILSFFAFMGSPANYHPYMSPFPAFVCFLISRFILAIYLGIIIKKKVVQKMEFSLVGAWAITQFGI